MVIARVSQLMQREFTGVHQAAFLLALATLFSKILALLRDRLLASTFGAGETLDIYYASFRIPDFLYTVSLFLAASTALIPLLLEKESEERAHASHFIGSVLSWFLVVIGGLGFLLSFAMPFLAPYIAPGFDGAAQGHIVLLSRILLLQALFLGLSNIAASIIQSFRLFFIYAISPILYNVGIIGGILFLYPLWGLPGLVGGVVVGSFFHFAIQVPAIIRLRFLPWFSLRITPELKRAASLSLPRALGLSLNQLVFIVITALASLFGLGSIAVFQLAYNLETVPLSIVGISYSIAAFPFLARQFVREERKKFLSYVSSALRHIVFWSLPATALLIVLRAHVVRVILGAGNFGWIDTRLTAAALAVFVFSLVAQALIVLYVRALYAGGKTYMPLFINVISSGIIIGAAFLLSYWFDVSSGFAEWFGSVLRVGDLPRIKVLLLPAAFSFGSIVNLLLLAFYFFRVFGPLDGKLLWRSIREIVFASFLLGAATFGGLRLFDGLFNLETFFGIFAHGLLAGIFGVLIAAAFLFTVGNREVHEVRGAFVRRFGRVPLISREPSSGTDI